MKKNLGAIAVMLVFGSVLLSGTVCLAQDQAGGGRLGGDAMGGAAIVFRKPSNPAASRSGGGRLPGGPKARRAAVTQDKTIARANAARSAPTPRYSEAEREYKIAVRQDPTDARV